MNLAYKVKRKKSSTKKKEGSSASSTADKEKVGLEQKPDEIELNQESKTLDSIIKETSTTTTTTTSTTTTTTEPGQVGDEFSLDKLKKKKKPSGSERTSTLDPKEARNIEKLSSKVFDVNTRKKKKKHRPGKRAPLLKTDDTEQTDDIDLLLNEIKVRLKAMANETSDVNLKSSIPEQKSASSAAGSYWVSSSSSSTTTTTTAAAATTAGDVGIMTKEVQNEGNGISVEKILNGSESDGGSLSTSHGSSKLEGVYDYSALTTRIYDLLKKYNPQLTSDKKRIVMKTPQIVKDGGSRTLFVNFGDICLSMGRPPEHVKEFVCSELGTTSSIGGDNGLLLKGIYKNKPIESILRKYMQEFVCCPMCGSTDTYLKRDANNRLFSIVCRQCHADKTVGSVHKGYQAALRKGDKQQKM